MRHQQIANTLASIEELRSFSDIHEVFSQLDPGPRPDWELPLLACLAVGGTESQAFAGSVSIACLQISIILIDDILDDDPRGEFKNRGVGPAANLAAAFQAAAFRVLSTVQASNSIQSSAVACLAHVALATAAGQQLDATNLPGEENYWRVVRAKSTPFYGGALQIGALLGGADEELAAELYRVGVGIGEIIQIEDDLNDAFAIPANPDWLQGRNNLLLLYASDADYPDREHFITIRSKVQDESFLLEAQRMLISSGALSYAAFNLIKKYKYTRKILFDLNLPNPQLLENILDDYAESLRGFLKLSGQEIPTDLFSIS